MRGQYQEPITDDVKEKFLELIESGHTRPEAADALDASARQFRSICNPESHRYDEDFARRYRKLTEKGAEHETALAERLKGAAVERAVRSSDRLLEKLLAIYDPDWEIHRPQALRMNIQVDELKMLFSGIPDETLQELVTAYEQRMLPQPDDIDM